MTLHERLMASPAAVNKMAALHTSGGDRTGREELCWHQFDIYETMLEKLPNWRRDQSRQRIKAVAPKMAAYLECGIENATRRIIDLTIAVGRLSTMPQKSFAFSDYNQYVSFTLWPRLYNKTRKMPKALRRELKLAVNGDPVPPSVRVHDIPRQRGAPAYRKNYLWNGVDIHGQMYTVPCLKASAT
jgi:hypothetical protein